MKERKGHFIVGTATQQNHRLLIRGSKSMGGVIYLPKKETVPDRIILDRITDEGQQTQKK